MARVAVITGGTSGIGFDVAKELSKDGTWQVNIVGSNASKGPKAAALLPNTRFFQADVRNYQQLASVFSTVFETARRLDFVFANAGVSEAGSFFAADTADTADTTSTASSTAAPPEPSLDLVRVNLDGALYTSYLAMHYFRRSPDETKGRRDLVLTASIGGLHPCALTPVYSATKHAIVGFTRSVGKKLFAEGMRVNCICPGVVRTPLLTENPDLLACFPGDTLVSIEKVTGVVLGLISGGGMEDTNGVRVGAGEMHSRAVHITGEGFYFAEMLDLPDDAARKTWGSMMG
ncbi:hypothetical protein BDV18DRAFT_163505 [Aspergillus unguis]